MINPVLRCDYSMNTKRKEQRNGTIYQLYLTGLTQRQIARAFKLTQPAVQKIIKKERERRAA